MTCPVTIVIGTQGIYSGMKARCAHVAANDVFMRIRDTIVENASGLGASVKDAIQSILDTAKVIDTKGTHGEYVVFYGSAVDLTTAMTAAACGIATGVESAYAFVGEDCNVIRIRGKRCTDEVANDIETSVMRLRPAFGFDYRHAWVDQEGVLNRELMNQKVTIRRLSAAVHSRTEILSKIFQTARQQCYHKKPVQWIDRMFTQIEILLDTAILVTDNADPVANCRWLDQADTYIETLGYLVQVPELWDHKNAPV